MKHLILENNSLIAEFSPLGSTITSLQVKLPDHLQETTLQYDTRKEVIDNPIFLNSVCGPHAGRIKNSTYIINDEIVDLHEAGVADLLHSGRTGLHSKVFIPSIEQNSIVMSYTDEQHTEYRCRYHLEEATLHITLEAFPLSPALINMTQHQYFNLSGESTIANHELLISADEVAMLDESGVPSASVIPVAKTVFDFNAMSRINDHLTMDHDQFRTSLHIDHPYLTNSRPVILRSQKAGLQVTIASDALVNVIYLGNAIDQSVSFKHHGQGHPHLAVAIEPQDLPNDINLGTSRSQVFDQNHPFRRHISYHFAALVKD